MTVVARPAATVVLLRPGDDGLEVLLTHRPSTMAFAADMHVFPGGRVDSADADIALAARSGITGEEAAERMGGAVEPDVAHAAFVAAIRETFEETGVLLADPASRHSRPDRRTLEVARAEVLHVPGAFVPMVEALDLRLRTDLLVPLSRWVTPAGLPRRFDAWFFAAVLPDGAEASLLGEEVVSQAWHTPRDALDRMASGEIGMWSPTSSTLQRLIHARSFADVAERLSPGPLGEAIVEEVVPGVIRIELPAGGGAPGQPVNAYLVGTSDAVLVDPGDPSEPALDRVRQVAAERGLGIVAVALTHADPDHAGGAEAIRAWHDIPILAGRGGGHDLPFTVTELADGATVDAGALRLRAIATPGPSPEHIAFVIEARADGTPVAVLAGDLDGVRGARSIPGPTDEAARRRSVARLRSAAPGLPWQPGHPA